MGLSTSCFAQSPNQKQERSNVPLKAFQICRKGEIQQDKIKIKLQVSSEIKQDEEWDDDEDYDLLERCQRLIFTIEIGELHERDKFSWQEATQIIAKTHSNTIYGKRRWETEFEFKINHIKQVVKLEISGLFQSPNAQVAETTQRTLFIGFYSFGRCILKSGDLCMPHQISSQLHRGISAKISLSEILKNGGYRCITLKAYDCKGGDFVESSELTMVLANEGQPLMEIGPEIALMSGPQGLYRLIEIGVNNYDPQLFIGQSFTIYFFKRDCQTPTTPTNSDYPGLLITKMKMDDRELLLQRIESNIVAMGEVLAEDIVQNAVNLADFCDVEPRNTQNLKKGQLDDSSEGQGMKVNLYNSTKTHQIGTIRLKKIQCRRRTSFLNLVADQILEVVPIIGIDYSMANLTFDDRKCIHSVNEDKPNEYRDLLQAIQKSYKLISPSSLFYGFGANSVTKVTEVSDLFVGTGDLINPIITTDSLDKEYYAALKRVELNLPVKFSKLIQKGVDFAEKSREHFQQDDNKNALSYFVMYILAAGIIDDLDSCVTQLTRAINLPISIFIVQIRPDSQEIDISRLQTKCQWLFQKANRQFLQVVEYKDVRLMSNAMQKLTLDVPFQIEQFFDSVSGGNYYIQHQNAASRKGLDLVREVLSQKEIFLSQIDVCGVEGVTRANVEKLIQEFKLYEYSIESCEILLGLKKRVDRS